MFEWVVDNWIRQRKQQQQKNKRFAFENIQLLLYFKWNHIKHLMKISECVSSKIKIKIKYKTQNENWPNHNG